MLGDPVKRLTFAAKDMANHGVHIMARVLACIYIVELLGNVTKRPALLAATERANNQATQYGYSDEIIAELIAAVDAERLGNRSIDRFIPWLAREFAKEAGNFNVIGMWLGLFSEGLVDWQAATKADVMKMSAEEVAAAIVDWRAVQGEKVVYTFPDGWTVKELVTPSALIKEGELQHHCVKQPSYAEAVAAGEINIYSLRDPDNEPHVTMEWTVADQRFEQMMMRWNKKPPARQYVPMLTEFARARVGEISNPGRLERLLRTLSIISSDPEDKAAATHDIWRKIDWRGFAFASAGGYPAIHAMVELGAIDFSGLDLNAANFRGCTLYKTNFTDAVLRNADFSTATFMGVDFMGADVAGASFFQATFRKPWHGYANDYAPEGWPQTSILAARNLDQVMSLKLADFGSNHLDGANFSELDLTGARFDGASLRGADFRGTILDRADFVEADLTGAKLFGAVLTGAKFSSGTIMPDGTHWVPPPAYDDDDE